MDVTHGRKCYQCEYGVGGFDPREMLTYIRYCTHPDVKGSDKDAPPPCGWHGLQPFKYPLFKERGHKRLSVEDVMVNLETCLYNRLKGKLLTVLESQMENPDKLNASKRITEDIISQSEKDVKEYLAMVFDNWGIEK